MVWLLPTSSTLSQTFFPSTLCSNYNPKTTQRLLHLLFPMSEISQFFSWLSHFTFSNRQSWIILSKIGPSPFIILYHNILFIFHSTSHCNYFVYIFVCLLLFSPIWLSTLWRPKPYLPYLSEYFQYLTQMHSEHPYISSIKNYKTIKFFLLKWVWFDVQC